MPATWLEFLLTRRYAVMSMGDPVPHLSTAAPAPASEEHGQHTGPFLILANHPARVDPLIVYAHFRSLAPLLMVEAAQRLSLRLLAGTAAILTLPPPPVAPDASTGEDTEALRTALTNAADALKAGRSVLLWPNPCLQSQGHACVQEDNHAFALLKLLQERGQALPELFLVRTEGLWGSRFSRYNRPEAYNPAFFSTLWAQIPALFLGPFLQRRPVRIVTRRHSLTSQQMNPQSFKNMLNTWFDASNEGAVLVPRLPLCPIRRMPLDHLTAPAMKATPPQPSPPTLAPQGLVAPPVAESTLLNLSPEQTGDDAVHTAAAPIEVPSPAPEDVNTCDISTCPENPHCEVLVQPAPYNAKATDAADTLCAAKNATNAPLADIAPAVPRIPPFLAVQHALTRQGSVTDASYGQHFSRRTLLGLAKAIGALLGPVPDTRIGIALPCGVGAMAAYMGILDCTLEDSRIPVLLNPALSADQLAHCAEQTGITHVVTCRSLQGKGLPPEASPVYLEDITPAQIMRGSALSFMGFAGATEMDTVAAVFCQDTTPVSLSHQDLMGSLHRLIENLKAAPLHVHSLSILGCLPPHTPVGLLANILLPLTCGVPIVTVNDSPNNPALARSAENYSVNFFTGTPDSLRNLLRHARSQLSFRFIMLTRESYPEDLLPLIPKACPHAHVMDVDMWGNIHVVTRNNT
ncbi:MAG: hypothetical protein RRY29_02290 [Desulfovibrionaceae bacterium]